MANPSETVSKGLDGVVAGWRAHVLEELVDNRFIRPQSNYTGPVGLKVAPIEKR
jgi:citrate synthase